MVTISLGMTSSTYSFLKFLVELVMIMEMDFLRKWKNLSMLSSLPKYTGSQWVILSFAEVMLIDSLMNALIEI